jgi:thioesterase domain-containing protein
VNAKLLLQARTVAQLADTLRDGTLPPSREGARLAVDLTRPPQPSDSESPGARKIFLIHAGGGSVHWYVRLADRLGEDFHVVGIQAAGLDGTESPLGDMQLIARRYWAEIRAVQPDGPCLLLGWSYGALVAHEMTRQRPRDVECAFLLEPPMVDGNDKGAARLASYVERYQRAAELWNKGQQEAGEAREAIERELHAVADDLEVARDHISLDEWLPYETLGLLYSAAMSHRVLPSTARATLFTSTDVRDTADGSTYSSGAYAEYLDYWNQACAGHVRVVDVPTPHMDMVSTPPALDVIVAEVSEFATAPKHR